MNLRVLNFLLIVTSLFGYLVWGGNNHAFLFQAEWEVILKLFKDPASVIHPLVLLPLAGQIMLAITVFQKRPGKKLSFVGLACLALLLVFIFAVGLLSFQYKMMLSATPFILVAIITIRELRNQWHATQN